MVVAEVGALLPAVGGAGRRVVEEEEEFVEEGDGVAVGVLGVAQAVEEGGEAWGFGWGFVGFWGNHKAAILRQVRRKAVALEDLDGLK